MTLKSRLYWDKNNLKTHQYPPTRFCIIEKTKKMKDAEKTKDQLINELKEQEFAEQLEFERLIADIASQLAQTRPEQLEVSIDSMLQALGRFFGTQRAFLAQFTDDGEGLFHRRIWAAEGIDVSPFFFELDMAAASPWFAQQIRMGKVINTGPGLVNLPDESGDLRERLQREGINSGVVVPVRVEGRSIGALGLDTVDQPREFPSSILDRLKIVADTVGSMLHRVQVQTKLQESERRFRAFMDNLPVYAYIKDNSDRHIYANEATLDYFGRQLDEFIGKRSEDFWPADLAEKLKRLDEKILSENEARVVEEWSHDHRGETHWIRDIKFPIHLTEDEKLLGGIGIDITERKRVEEELEEAFSEIKRLNTQLEAENVYLREEIELQHHHVEIIGKSKAVSQMLNQAEQVANTDSTVLILGETGTGKELLARAIHRMSSRTHHPMITVNCAALPASLIESEMFGREKGAFTGALSGRIGRFEVADDSTIFLDEIGELTPDIQMKLMRVLEEGHFERLGSNKTIKVDVRIIAATNRDLVKAVHDGSFRRDLYYRLNVFPIKVPSLHDRIEDLELLVWAFVKEYGDRMGKRIEKIPKKSIEALKRCPWRGNIRELRNVIEQSMIITQGPSLNVQLPGVQGQSEIQGVLLKDVERNHILKILKQTGWRVRGKAGAAELLGLKPTTLDARMKKLGVVRPK
jgi:PAS domain S-box-containing protein